jgi:chromosome segregation ATPase
MKNKAAIIVVLIVALGLGAALLVVNNNARKQQQDAQARLGSLSNEMVTVRGDLQEQQQVNLALSSNLTATTTSYSNKLSESDASLHATQASLDKAQADAKAAADAASAEITQRDKKISELETTNADLDKQAEDLHTAIAGLQTQITETKGKLASSEGDRKFLLGELQRLVSEKADLEKKFNDVASLKTQLRKVRDELAQARRLDWMRRGLYAMDKEKGGERLMRHEQIPASSSGVGVSLDVELRTNAAPKVLTETNLTPTAPPAISPP